MRLPFSWLYLWWIAYRRYKSKDEHSVPIRAEVAGIIKIQQEYIREQLGEEFNYLFCTTNHSSYFEKYGQTSNKFPLHYFEPVAKIITHRSLK